MPTIICILASFLLTLGHDVWKRKVTEPVTLVGYMLVASNLPDIFQMVFYLLTAPEKAFNMPQSANYLAIGILIVFYAQIKKELSKKDKR